MAADGTKGSAGARLEAPSESVTLPPKARLTPSMPSAPRLRAVRPASRPNMPAVTPPVRTSSGVIPAVRPPPPRPAELAATKRTKPFVPPEAVREPLATPDILTADMTGDPAIDALLAVAQIADAEARDAETLVPPPPPDAVMPSSLEPMVVPEADVSSPAGFAVPEPAPARPARDHLRSGAIIGGFAACAFLLVVVIAAKVARTSHGSSTLPEQASAPALAAYPAGDAKPLPPAMNDVAPAALVAPPAASTRDAVVPEGAARAPAGMGFVDTSSARPGRRIFVDDRVVGQTPASVLVKCGRHRLRIGSTGKASTLDVPCAGELAFHD